MDKIRALCLIALAAAPSLYGSEASTLLGSVLLRGVASLNDKPVSGYAVILGENDRFRTGVKSGAIVTLATGDTITVSENTTISLARSSLGTVARFDAGNIAVATRRERLQELQISGGSLTIRTLPGMASRYLVARLGNTTYVLPAKGSLSIDRPGRSSTNVPEGKMGVVEDSGYVQEYIQRAALALPQKKNAPAVPVAQSSARAGQLSAVIPAEYIVRGSSQTNGNVGDAVLLNDLLKTGPRGRMRFTLDDGSIVTVGSNSQFQVKDQNTQSQQSSVEMLYGKMRAQVSKRTVTGGKFEIRTSTAICGVIGTDLYVDATPTRTRIIVFDGIVKIMPLVTGAAGFTLTAGQTAVMTSSGATSPVAATTSQLQSAMNGTQVLDGAQAAAAGGAATASAGMNVAVVAATLAPPAIAAAAISAPLITQSQISPTRP